MSQSYFEKIFRNSTLDWKTIYLLPCIATVDTTIRVFQYKLLNDVLFLNKVLYRFGISQNSLCFFCSLEEKLQCMYSTVAIMRKFFGKDLSILYKTI